MLISGTLRGTASSGVRSVDNPATGEQLALVPECGRMEAEEALSAAEHALADGAWPHLDSAERALRIHRLADRIEEDLAMLAMLITLDSGKPLREARHEVRAAAAGLREAAHAASAAAGRAAARAGVRAESWAVPAGVVVVLGSAGMPFLSLAERLGPALMSGDAAILKPSELAPLAALRLGELVRAELPEAVMQVLPGAGGSFAQLLCGDPRTGVVAAFCSAGTARAIERVVDPSRTALLLEVGRPAAIVVRKDADLDAAADRVVLAACLGQGSTPWSAHRLIVEEAVHDQLLMRIANRLSRIVVGNGLDPETELGPLISAPHLRAVEALVERAKRQGAALLVGGTRLPAMPGCYFAPTLLVGCTAEMEIASVAPFAPLIAMESADGPEAAIRTANRLGSAFLAIGLTGSDPGVRSFRDGLRAENVWINHAGWPERIPAVPAGPYARSRTLLIADELVASGWYRGN